MPVVVRTARAEDAPHIQALYRQLVDHPMIQVTPQRLSQVGQDPSLRVMVACQGGRVVGTVMVALCGDVMFGHQPFAVLENLVVDEAARGLGAGRALMQAAERFAVQADCSKMMLLSSASRSQAHRFFERQGFAGDAKRGFVRYRRQMNEPVAAKTPAPMTEQPAEEAGFGGGPRPSRAADDAQGGAAQWHDDRMV